MTYEYKNFVKAQFFSDGQLYNVKVRIRGLSPNHWIDEKKSWRINFNKEKLFNHKKSVNLIIPQDRGYFAEYLSNHVARKLGLLVPEDKFAFFRINGVLQGIYYEIEQPNGSFLEFHGKVDKANLYRENSWDWHKYGFPEIFSDVGHWKKQSSEEVSGFENYADLDYLISLLQNKDKKRFYREIPALLNMDNFLTWQAHSMIFGSYHQSGKANMLIYSNIIDGRFELIPFDVNLFAFDGTFIDKPYNPLVDRILSDSEYLHRRNMILWEYVKNENSLIDDLKFYDSAHKKYRNGFYADRNKGFTNAHFEQEVKGLRGTFLKNRKKIIANLKFSSVLAGTHLFCNDPSVLASIDMASQGFSALELSAIKFSVTENEKASDYDHLGLYYDSNGSGSFENSDRLLANFSIDVSGKSLNSNNFSFLLYPGRNEDLKPAKKYYRFFIASEEQSICFFWLFFCNKASMSSSCQDFQNKKYWRYICSLVICGPDHSSGARTISCLRLFSFLVLRVNLRTKASQPNRLTIKNEITNNLQIFLSFIESSPRIKRYCLLLQPAAGTASYFLSYQA